MIQELITEIDERNRLRLEAGLPLLSVASEVRKIYEARRARDFEHFVETSPLRKQIEDELLAHKRLARRDPEWKPTGMLSGGGWAFYVEVRERLRRHYSV
jgi:hypothetical protein